MYRQGGCSIARYSVFPALDRQTRINARTVGKYRFEQLVAECFCAAVIEKQLRNNGLPVPLGRDDTVGGLFCHRRLLSRVAKRDFP